MNSKSKIHTATKKIHKIFSIHQQKNLQSLNKDRNLLDIKINWRKKNLINVCCDFLQQKKC